MSTDLLDNKDILDARLTPLQQHAFAVIDGAKFEDLPFELMKAGVNFTSQYREGMDPDHARAGPWLLSLSYGVYDKIKPLLAERVAAFWICQTGREVLLSHLRGVNAILLPDGAMMLFRHYDPRVLEIVAPVLDPGQRQRFLGPAERVVIQTADGLLEFESPENVPATRGTLRVDQTQYDEIEYRHILCRIAPDIREYNGLAKFGWSNRMIDESVRWSWHLLRGRPSSTMLDHYDVATMHCQFGEQALEDTKIVDFLKTRQFPISNVKALVDHMCLKALEREALSHG